MIENGYYWVTIDALPEIIEVWEGKIYRFDHYDDNDYRGKYQLGEMVLTPDEESRKVAQIGEYNND